MFNKGQLAGLMKQAQAMQDNLKKAQDELAFVEVEGASGGGMVKVLMTCKHAVNRVTIDPTLMNDDKDMLEDLVAAASSGNRTRSAGMSGKARPYGRDNRLRGAFRSVDRFSDQNLPELHR